MKKIKLMWPFLIIVFLVVLLVIFLPVPHYRSGYCLLSNISSECPPAGWYFEDSIGQKFLNQIFDHTGDNKECGTIFGYTCPAGYRCKYDDSYPDAGGTCMKKFLNLF